jgi:hypothetical protein
LGIFTESSLDNDRTAQSPPLHGGDVSLTFDKPLTYIYNLNRVAQKVAQARPRKIDEDAQRASAMIKKAKNFGNLRKEKMASPGGFEPPSPP